jgi:GNAT superfamily N-acetyltransferase
MSEVTTAGTLAAQDLGDGLVLRWATAADSQRLADFNAQAFRNEEADAPQPSYRAATLEMMSGRHPLIGAEDFVYVEDTATGAIVSSACLLRQRWEYEGIPFAVGRPEYVATDAAYRNRGLIRALFAALHARSAACGDLVQGITGIPYFYRQFGYEYALELEGGRALLPATLPALPTGESESYTLRDASAADLPLIAALYDREREGYAVSATVPDAYWRYAILPFSTPEHPGGEFDRKWWLRVIVDRAGVACGYVRTGTTLWGDTLYVWDLVVREGVQLRAAALATLRALIATGPDLIRATAAVGQQEARFAKIMLNFGGEHPLYVALGTEIAPFVSPPYAWYVRVPDLPAFLTLITPVLERRLAASPLAAWSGEVRLDFYRGGLRLTFEAGRLTAVVPWQRPIWGERQHASFPPFVFLQLLFGYRSLAALCDAFPDVRASGEIAALLDALFPQRRSLVAMLD